MDTLPFYLFLFVHLVSLIVGMGAVILIDVMGLLWVFGKTQATFLVKVAQITQRIIWTGWAGLVLSGIGLVTIKGYVDSLTAIKLFLVFMVGVNGIALHFIKHAMGRMTDYESVPAAYKYQVMSASVISQVGWWGAISIGFLHRHWQHHISWPQSPWPGILTIAIGWLAIVLVGQLWLAKQHHRRS